MDKLTQDLLDAYQRDFPVTSEPFAEMARCLGYQEDDVLAKLEEIKAQGIVTRVGPVFDHRRAGSSLLAAIKVPPPQLEEVAKQINQFAEVNHNYGREHEYNLWFVATAPTKTHLEQALLDMERTTGFPILRLPMEQGYHIDLGFHLWTDSNLKSSFACHSDPKVKQINRFRSSAPQISPEKQKQLRVMIQDGLPLIPKPFEQLAAQLQVSEDSVISTFQHWLDSGLIKRMGLVTNHHRLGFTSNAMVVWDIPDNQVDGIGEAFKHTGLVSLCYRRTRHLPEWKYNLYCMIHSRDRETVQKHVDELVTKCGLQDISKEVLFSNRQFKQKGGQYMLPSESRDSDSHSSKGAAVFSNNSVAIAGAALNDATVDTETIARAV